MSANTGLSSLDGTRSGKLLEILAKLEMSGSSSQWSILNDYNSAQQFARGITIVNDGAETCICSIHV